MNDIQQVLERTAVTRLRVSQVATRIHDGLDDAVRDPDRFEALLQSPRPVQGLPLTLPYVDPAQTRVDMEVWSSIAETQLTGTLNSAAAKKLRKEAVPLRLHADLSLEGPDLGGMPPYIDVHVHPFGVVAIATVDMTWSEPAALDDAWSKIAEVNQRRASITVRATKSEIALGAAPGAAADRVVELLTAHAGEHKLVPDYRVATVIDGTIEPVPTVMPADASPLHVALHYLCGGGDPPAPPGNCFVPVWSGGGFRYWPRQLAYVVDKGTAVWGAPDAHAAPTLTLGQQHRRLTLMLAHLTASIGLIDVSMSSASAAFKAWSKTAANRLARLYGPNRAEHGIEPRRYLDQTGFRALVETVLGTQLKANDAYPLPEYV